MGIKSKEARKYIFNCLDDMMQVRREPPLELLLKTFFEFSHAAGCQTATSCHSAGEHDKPGGDRHPGREGRQAGVHRPAEEDADAGRGQADHAHEDSEPPLCHHDTPAALPSQLTVRRHLQACADAQPGRFIDDQLDVFLVLVSSD